MNLNRHSWIWGVACLLASNICRAQADDESQTLVALARAKFDTLTSAEELLCREVERGALHPVGPASMPGPEEQDRLVHADLVRWLCTNGQAVERVTERGVRLKNTVVEGELHLEHATVTFPLQFSSCLFSAAIFVTEAKLHSLDFRGCEIERLLGDRAHLEHDLRVGRGFTATGAVRLQRSRIGGSLKASGGAFRHDEGNSLDLENAEIKVDVLLEVDLDKTRFYAANTVDLSHTTIGGRVLCKGGQFNGKRVALTLDAAEVEGAVWLGTDEGGSLFVAKGPVLLNAAKIGGPLRCAGGQFDGPKVSLDFDGANIAGSALLNTDGRGRPFVAAGKVRFEGAAIGDTLNCIGGQFKGEQGSLLCDGAQIGGPALMHTNKFAGSFFAASKVSLANVSTKRGCNLQGARLEGSLSFAGSQIAGDVLFGCDKYNRFTVDGAVHLTRAQIRGDLRCHGGDFSESLNCDGAWIDGDVSLESDAANRRFSANGPVEFDAATIGGEVRCGGAEFRSTLRFYESKIGRSVFLDVDQFGNRFSAQSEVNFVRATIGGDFRCPGGQFNSKKRALYLDAARISGMVWLGLEEKRKFPFTAEGKVTLIAAKIGGPFNCNGGQFNAPDVSLDLSGAEIDGSLSLSGRDDCHFFSAEGKVAGVGTRIGRHFVCRGGDFNHTGQSLVFTGSLVGGRALLDENFAAAGEVNFEGAVIGGELRGTGGQFNGKQNSLVLSSSQIGGRLLLDADSPTNRFAAAGSVQAQSAVIKGGVRCTGGQFLGRGDSLFFESAQIGGRVLMDSDSDCSFKSVGRVQMHSASIDGELRCTGGEFGSLSCFNARIVGDLKLDGVIANTEISLRRANVVGDLVWSPGFPVPDADLRFAQVGSLSDQPDSHWPEVGHLQLDGFVYDQLGTDAGRDLTSRIEWVRNGTATYSSQPYQQLGSLQMRNGNESNARQVLQEMERARGLGDPTVDRIIWYYGFGWLIGYGYNLLRASLVAIAVVLFSGRLIERNKDLMVQIGSPSNPNLRFSPFVYSLDTFAPLIDLQQARFWLPKPNARMLRRYLWAHTLFGWVLTTLLVLGLTGLVWTPS